jgi:hypothetical protein
MCHYGWQCPTLGPVLRALPDLKVQTSDRPRPVSCSLALTQAAGLSLMATQRAAPAPLQSLSATGARGALLSPAPTRTAQGQTRRAPPSATGPSWAGTGSRDRGPEDAASQAQDPQEGDTPSWRPRNCSVLPRQTLRGPR